MAIVSLANAQLQAARCIGRKDFDGAIRVLEQSLASDSKDIPYLDMIALCHRWSHRDDIAIATAHQTLVYDPKHFGAIRLLSEIHAERKEHDTATQFVRLGLENYPEPLPPTPMYLFWILRVVAVVFPRFKRIEEAARRDIGDPSKGDKESYSWAKQYLAWYDSTFGNQRSPTVH